MVRLLNISHAPNPIGNVHQVNEVEEQLLTLVQQWDEQLEEQKWHWHYWLMPWKWVRKVSLFQVTDFLIKSLDRLIDLVDDKLDFGADKKATVLDAIDRLYGYIVKEALPFWLKPFASRVKDYIINVLISTAIDWIVNKYRNGEWRDKYSAE